MSEEEAGSPPVPDDKPFFAIDVGDLSEEQEVSPTVSDAPPTPMMMGSLSGSISPAEDSAPADQTNPNPWTSTGPQLTGDVSEFSGQAMYAVPPMDKKEGFRWRQFFLGLFVPYIALTLLFVVEGAFQEDWDDVYRGEDIILDSEDNRTFETTLSPRSNEVLGDFWASHYTDDGVEIAIRGWSWESEAPSSITQYTYTNTGSNESEIGTYYPSNNTAYFVLDYVEINRLYLYVEYVDFAELNSAESGTDIGEFLFCLLPIAYVAGTIAAFVKGNNALAYGLLTALPLGFVIFPLLFFLLLVFAFGIY
jgi:hypothetical protein